MKSKEWWLNAFKHRLITAKHKQHLFYGWRADAQRSAGSYSESSAKSWWCYLIVLNCITASPSLSATQSPCLQVRIQSEVQVTRVQCIFFKRTQLNRPSKLCQLDIAEIHLRRESPWRNYLYRLVCGNNYGGCVDYLLIRGWGHISLWVTPFPCRCSGLYKKVR